MYSYLGCDQKMAVSPEDISRFLIEELNNCGIRDEDILIISATGTHRRQTKEEHMGLVTEEIYNRIKLVDHQCTDEENLKYGNDHQKHSCMAGFKSNRL